MMVDGNGMEEGCRNELDGCLENLAMDLLIYEKKMTMGR